MVIVKTFFIISVVLASILYIQKEDYNDEVNSFNQYCKDMESGLHPDYKGIKYECEENLK